MKAAELDLYHARGHDGPVAEFNALREEIQERFKANNHLLSLQLTLSSAIVGFAISAADVKGLLLILPFSSYLLCGRLVAQHFAIERIATYIATYLSPRVPGGLYWEYWLGTQRQRPHVLGSTLPLALTFVGTSVLALTWTAITVQDHVLAGNVLVGVVAIWALGWLATVMSLMLVLQQAGRLRARAWRRASLS